jgi:Na+/H+ antiporter NhaB
VTAINNDSIWVSDPLGEDLNCQLEVAGIAGTRTPSTATSNYQLGWFFRLTSGTAKGRELSLPALGGRQYRPATQVLVT